MNTVNWLRDQLNKLVEENPEYGERPVVINGKVHGGANGKLVREVELVVLKRWSPRSDWSIDYDPDWELEDEEERMSGVNVTS